MKMMKRKRSSRFVKVMSLVAMPTVIVGTLLFCGQLANAQEVAPEKNAINEVVVVGYGTNDSDSQTTTKTVDSSKKSDVASEKVFMVVEKMPGFPGGVDVLLNYLSKNVKYPDDAVKKRIQASIYVEYIVGTDGKIRDAKILAVKYRNSENETVETSNVEDPMYIATHSLREEALRVVNAMPNWEPGMQKGNKVSVSYRLPINFELK